MDEVTQKVNGLRRARAKLHETQPNKNERKEAKRKIDKQIDEVTACKVFFFDDSPTLCFFQLEDMRKGLLATARDNRRKSQLVMEKQVHSVAQLTKQLKEQDKELSNLKREATALQIRADEKSKEMKEQNAKAKETETALRVS